MLSPSFTLRPLSGGPTRFTPRRSSIKSVELIRAVPLPLTSPSMIVFECPDNITPCGDTCSLHYSRTRLPGHDGDHYAEGPEGQVCASWRQGESDGPIREYPSVLFNCETGEERP